jgi:PKD repeat protein
MPGHQGRHPSRPVTGRRSPSSGVPRDGPVAAQEESDASHPPHPRGKWYRGAIVSLLSVTAMVIAVLGQPSARAWSGDPGVNTPVCTAVQDQLWNSMAAPIVSRPNIVSDGAGGAIIAWYDNRTAAASAFDIYAQRISSSGVALWGDNGRAICTSVRNQQSPVVVSDGLGGAIIAWQDYRAATSNADIYAQRLSASGDPVWADNGTRVCTSTRSQLYPMMISDGSGGAIVTWQDYRSGTNYDIYAQRLNSTGGSLWTDNGTAICTSPGNQTYQTQATDGSGGAIITWQDYRGGASADIYAEKVDSSGSTPWPIDNGVAICGATDNQQYPAVVGDGSGGAIVAWQDRRGGTYYDIYAQMVDADGNVPVGWPAYGAAICTAAYSQVFPVIASDGSGGAIIAWQDYRDTLSMLNIYGQRVDSGGAGLWDDNGTAICTAGREQQNPTLIGDGSGGAIIAWQDYRNYSSSGWDIYALMVSSSGSAAAGWDANGERISTAAGIQQYPCLTGDGSGGAIVAWRDRRTYGVSLWDLYAQKVKGDGSLPVPPRVTGVDPALGDQGQSISGVTITGENFTGAASVSFGSEVTVDDFTVSSDTSILADITIDPAAAPGTRGITVTTGEGVGTLPHGFTVHPALLADFHADRVEAAAGQDVHFTDDSSGGSGSFSYEWDFGDTGTSTDQNPSHAYAAPGTYTVSLTVTDSADNPVTETKTDCISVVDPPDADFSADPTALLVGQTVSFTDLSSGGVGSLSHEWEFGDTGTSTDQDPSHAYADPGTYTVTLTVTDSATNTDTETKTGYITVVAGPHADFAADDTVAMAGDDIHFASLSSGGIAPLSYEWDFNNDGTWDGTAEDEPYAYSSPGTYTVVLRITDAAANADNETKVDYIVVVQSCDSASTAGGTGTVEICTSAGVLENLAGVSEDLVPDGGRPNLIFSHGLFEFDITGLTPGQSVTLIITLPSSTPTTTQYWKYGPTSADPAGEWYSIPLGSNDGDNVITITLRDGGAGDDDLTADGSITDQGGPGTPRPPEPAPAFPSVYTGVAGALGAAVLAYLIRRRLAGR